MQENTSVQQLAEALEQLLNAYDKLKYENKQTLEHNKTLELQIQELENSNTDLESQVEELSDKTNHNSNEIGNMLGRIKSILVETPQNETIENETEQLIHENKEEIEEEGISNEVYPEQSTFDENLMDQTQEIEEENKENEATHKEDNKDFDLGRMQSLLNGFNK